MNGEKVTFPKLSNIEIVNCLNDLGVQQLTEANLVKPDSEFVHVLYENAVQKLMGLSEDMAKPVYEAYQILDYPQLYDAAIYEITFMRNLFRVMHTVGVDFKLSDLLAPTYARTRYFLSGTINFAKYREEKFSKFQELDYEASQLAEELILAEVEDQSAQEELKALKIEIADEESSAHELHEKRTQVENNLHALNQLQANLQEERLQIKTKRQAVISQVESLCNERQRMEKEKIEIQSRILEHPEKTIKAMEDLRSHLLKERKALEESEMKRNVLALRLKVIEDDHKAFDKCIALLVEINQEIDRIKNEKKEVKDHKNMVAYHENALRELDVNQQQVARQLIATSEKKKKSKNQESEERENYKQSVELERAKKNNAERENVQVLSKIKELDLQITKLEAEEKSITRSHEFEINMLETGLDDMVKQLRQYHSDLLNSIQHVDQHQEAIKQDKTPSPIV